MGGVCVAVDAYLIQYKFIVPKTLSHSSYTYQKLFRALYGYTQAVYKSNGKTYKYHRKGILSDVPFIRPTKNTVIIPPGTLQKLLNFFNTGQNPAHNWVRKGEWKAVYYLNEKKIDEQKAAKALETTLSRALVNLGETPVSLFDALKSLGSGTITESEKQSILNSSKNIICLEWFSKTAHHSEKLMEFKRFYDSVKS